MLNLVRTLSKSKVNIVGEFVVYNWTGKFRILNFRTTGYADNSDILETDNIARSSAFGTSCRAEIELIFAYFI